MSAATLTASHYRAQLAIKAHAVRTSQSLWTLWNGEQSGWGRLLDLSLPVLGQLHQLSGQTARQYYSELAASSTGRPDRALPVRELPQDQAVRSLTTTGLAGTFAARSRGLSVDAARQLGFVKFSGSFSRLAMLGGRDVLTQTTVAPQSLATAWKRVTSGDPCDFCESLSGAKVSEDSMPCHDHCSCSVEPVFG